MKSKPAHEIKIDGVKATIWPNDGKGGSRYTVNTSRSFKVGEQWRQTTSFHKSDLPKLIEVITQAEQWIKLHECNTAENSAA